MCSKQTVAYALTTLIGVNGMHEARNATNIARKLERMEARTHNIVTPGMQTYVSTRPVPTRTTGDIRGMAFAPQQVATSGNFIRHYNPNASAFYGGNQNFANAKTTIDVDDSVMTEDNSDSPDERNYVANVSDAERGYPTNINKPEKKTLRGLKYVLGLGFGAGAFHAAKAAKTMFYNNDVVTKAVGKGSGIDLHDVMFTPETVTKAQADPSVQVDYNTLDTGIAVHLMVGALMVAISLFFIMWASGVKGKYAFLGALFPVVAGGVVSAGFINQIHPGASADITKALIYGGSILMGIGVLLALAVSIYKCVSAARKAKENQNYGF